MWDEKRRLTRFVCPICALESKSTWIAVTHIKDSRLRLNVSQDSPSPPIHPSRSSYRFIPPPSSPPMADIKNSLHVLSPGDKSYPHCHSVITGRKSWKTLKGKTEAVWPPYLEVALFEGAPASSLVISIPISSFPPKGLSRYQPSNPRATKSLGRFPNRNRFISEYILKKTGKHRTPKQVGSRLQQLRDTHQGKQRMLHLTVPPFFPHFISFLFPL